MNFGHSLEKKENLSDQELELGESSKEVSENQGDRWTFAAILPDSSFIHTLHHGERNLEEATKFVSEIKSKSDKQSPLFASDDWFYEKALLAVMVMNTYRSTQAEVVIQKLKGCH